MTISAWVAVFYALWSLWYINQLPKNWHGFKRLGVWCGVFLGLGKLWDSGWLKFSKIEPLDIPNYTLTIPIVPNPHLGNDLGLAYIIALLGCAVVGKAALKWMGNSKR